MWGREMHPRHPATPRLNPGGPEVGRGGRDYTQYLYVCQVVLLWRWGGNRWTIAYLGRRRPETRTSRPDRSLPIVATRLYATEHISRKVAGPLQSSPAC